MRPRSRWQNLISWLSGSPRTNSRPRPRRSGLSVESLESRDVFNAAAAAAAAVSADTFPNYHPANHSLPAPLGVTFGPVGTKAADIAVESLTAHAGQLGLAPTDLANPIVTSGYADRVGGMSHVYLRQQINGLEVIDANLAVSVTPAGTVFTAAGSFVHGLASRVGTAPVNPTLMALGALNAAAAQLGLTATSPPVVTSAGTDLARTTTISAPGIAEDPVQAHLQYVPTPGGSAVLAWNLIIRVPGGLHAYDASVDAATGKLLRLADWVDNETYNVVAPPNQDPNDPTVGGGFTTLTNPADPTASPYGWHDTNGAAGAEFTDTRGNNVDAHLDLNANDVADADEGGGARPDGGASLNFTGYTYNAAQAATTAGNQAIAQVNLYTSINIAHDIHYQYGFDEVSGNFQVNNYGRGGAGGDAVQADAQDGSGTDNANFYTPPDGQPGRMQQYVFDLTNPTRDSDLDNDVIIHEFGHGVSNRLTGGPANSSALVAQQSGSMGEGWSDFYSLMFTQRSSDLQNDAFPVGNWVLGYPSNGPGVRIYPYSYNMAIDPHTLGDYNSDQEVHDAGEIWCSVLWDINWQLINRYGYDSNLYTGYTAAAGPGHAGNKLALKLVMDGMKLQPANPSFLDARDAIINADVALTGGANYNLLWQAFARRGFGYSASTASADSLSVTPAFDLPPTADPSVTASTPTGPTYITALVDHVDFTFSEPMVASSFSVAADVGSFTGPSGNLLPSITGFSWLAPNKLRVNFDGQFATGNYSMTMGPNILAVDNGNAMDQDRNGTPGQATDSYTATFSLAPQYTVAATPVQAIDLNVGDPGVIVVHGNNVDDSSVPIDLGTNTFNLYGTTYTGANSLFVSSNGMITLGSANSEYVNADFTSDPAQAAVAPLWDDLHTQTTGNVLARFDDLNSDGTPDQLVVEWSGVQHYYTSPSDVTFQAILKLNTGARYGDIVLNYPDLDFGDTTLNNGASATTGIKAAGAQSATSAEIVTNYDSGTNPLVASGSAVKYFVVPLGLVRVSPTSGLTTTEAGGQATFTVRLGQAPTANVTIPVSSSNTAEGTVSVSSLTFTPANWNIPQTVTVTGVDDFVDDGDIAYSILLDPIISSDPTFNAIDPVDVSVTNTDDDTAGITVTPTSGLVTTEAGGQAFFTVVLTSQPLADVTVGLTSSDTTEGTVSPASLTFTAANWNFPQTVAVTGVDDFLIDGDIPYTIVTTATSSDGLYNAIDPPDVSVVNRDNDVPDGNVLKVTSPSADGYYKAGSVVTTSVVFDRPVTVVGVPSLSLNSGGTAFYRGGSGTPTLTFTYTVGAGQNSPHLDYASASALTGTILGPTGSPSTLTLPAPGSPASLGAARDIIVDTTAPRVTGYSLIYGTNQSYSVFPTNPTRVLPWTITGIRITFSEPVTSSTAGLTGIGVTSVAGSGTNQLTFQLGAVQQGIFTVNLGTGTTGIRDRAGNAAASYTRSFSVLYGDASGNGTVSPADVTAVRAGLPPAVFSPFNDLNGDGVVNQADVTIATNRNGAHL